ncbi:MAG: polymerase, sigma-24 subunit, subfamily [Aeromicrobium sp.]|nr:polymerase, sigma-24 subunit, subfamily [Aeromicrobium sp.]
MGEDEFAETYASLRDPIFSYAARRLSPEQAKDVVGDTFEIVWRTRHDLPADRTEWPSWIVGIARNKVLQEIDRSARKHHDGRFLADVPDGVTGAVTSDVADLVATSAGGRWVWNQLTSAERELLDLAFIRQIDRHDAARILGVTPTAYASRLTRLRERIVRLDAASEAPPSRSDGRTPDQGARHRVD